MFDEWWGGQWVVGDTLLLAVRGVHQAADIVVGMASLGYQVHKWRKGTGRQEKYIMDQIHLTTTFIFHLCDTCLSVLQAQLIILTTSPQN